MTDSVDLTNGAGQEEQHHLREEAVSFFASLEDDAEDCFRFFRFESFSLFCFVLLLSFTLPLLRERIDPDSIKESSGAINKGTTSKLCSD